MNSFMKLEQSECGTFPSNLSHTHNLPRLCLCLSRIVIPHINTHTPYSSNMILNTSFSNILDAYFCTPLLFSVYMQTSISHLHNLFATLFVVHPNKMSKRIVRQVIYDRKYSDNISNNMSWAVLIICAHFFLTLPLSLSLYIPLPLSWDRILSLSLPLSALCVSYLKIVKQTMN